MSSNGGATETPTSFVERIWPVIDVHARLRRLVEADDRRRRAIEALPETVPAIA